MSNDKSPKVKNMMYTQQIDHLPPGIATKEDLEAIIVQKLRPKRYGIIVHDQDVNDKGQPAEPHIHAMLCFTNARHISAIAKKLGDQPQNIAKWDDSANNGFAYLVHMTNSARKSGKHRYDLHAVLANFDFVDLMDKIGAEVIQAKAEYQAKTTIKPMLDALYIGAISKDEIEKQLSGSQYAKYHRQIEDVNAKRLLNQAEKWRAEMREKNAQISVVWIFGSAGTGKTSLAKAYAKKVGQPYFIAGSSRDIFQGYNGEHTVILDELRPRVMEYCDLLRILDPYGIENQVMAPSRYNDKALACDLIIITAPYNPLEFYKHSRIDDMIDDFRQLSRRITLTICMDSQEINAMEFNEHTNKYDFITGSNRKNYYSSLMRPTPFMSAASLYKALID